MYAPDEYLKSDAKEHWITRGVDFYTARFVHIIDRSIAARSASTWSG